MIFSPPSYIQRDVCTISRVSNELRRIVATHPLSIPANARIFPWHWDNHILGVADGECAVQELLEVLEWQRIAFCAVME
jgi:hypothetical protein